QVGKTHCPNCGRSVKAQTIYEIASLIIKTLDKGGLKQSGGCKIQILSPIIQRKKGTFADLFDNLLSKGFLRIRIDGETHSLDESDTLKLNKNKTHTIDLIIDRLVSPTRETLAKKDTSEFKEFEKRLT